MSVLMGRYRKPNRRQRHHPVWSPRPYGRRTVVWPVPPTGDVTASFLLPGELSLIAPGRHGVGPGMTVDRISLTADERISR
jgi:hypothetical protein